MIQQIEQTISWKAIVRVVLTFAILYLIWNLNAIILIILVSLMFASALNPIVVKLSKYIPFTLAAVICVFSIVVPLLFLVGILVPNLVLQIPAIFQSIDKEIGGASILPDFIKHIDFVSYAKQNFSSQNVGNYLLASTSWITNFVASLVSIIFLTLYLLIDAKRLKNITLSLFPKEHRQKVEDILHVLAKINGQYIRGNLFISLICTLTIYVGLSLLNVPYAGSLALFAGVFDLLPLIGGMVATTPALIIGFSVNIPTVLLVLLLFIVYQQTENNIVSPNIYNKALNLSPALSFVAVLIGGSLFGIVGAFISLPIAASIPTLIKHLRNTEI